jgi:hypothetical protein
MKTVLIIAYDFPPLRTSGVYRPLKFAKYLPEFGWRPIILTVKNFPETSLDQSLLKDLPESAKIYRAHSFELKRFEKTVFDRIYRSSAAAPAAPKVAETKPQTASSAPTSSGFSVKSLIKRGLLSPISHFTHNYLYNPDEWVGWIPMAVQVGRKAIRDENVDVIISTSPPETNHLVGLWLKRLTGKPWVADFRDPWTDNVIKQNKPKARFNSERRAERRVLKKADAIINVGERFGRMSQESFPEVDPAKHFVITNGYDESDYGGFDAAAIYEKNQTPQLNLLNVGTVYPNSGFDQFVRGLDRVLSRPDYQGKIKLTIVGALLPDQLAALSREPLKSHVELNGFLPHAQALNHMMAADVILLMPSGGDARTRDKIVPGKLFELLRSGRPLLMIGWDGESAELVRRSGSGIFVAADDLPGIEKAIVEFYGRKQTGQLQNRPNWDYIRQFDRKALTSRLVDVLELARTGSVASSPRVAESLPAK